MTPKEALQSILDHEYKTEDGDKYKVDLIAPMTETEIEEYRNTLPNKHLPEEIEDLLKFSRGFSFQTFDDIQWDTFGDFGFEEVFPHSIPLVGDGFGNFWVLDIDSQGQWKSVYYVCHAPAVIVKHSENLAEFILHVDEFGRLNNASHLMTIHRETVEEIYTNKEKISEEKVYHFTYLSERLPAKYRVANLKDKATKSGFIWGLSGPHTKIIRPSDEPLWIVEHKKKSGFFSNLFRRRRY